MFVVVLTLVFTDVTLECAWCEKLDCYDFVDGLCERAAQYNPFV